MSGGSLQLGETLTRTADTAARIYAGCLWTWSSHFSMLVSSELECSVSPYSYSLGIGEKNGFPERVLVEVVLIFTERLEHLQNPDSRQGKDDYLFTFWMA